MPLIKESSIFLLKACQVGKMLYPVQFLKLGTFIKKYGYKTGEKDKCQKPFITRVK